MDHRVAGAKWWPLITTGKVGSHYDGQLSQSSNEKSLIRRDLRHCLIDLDVPKREVGGKPTKFSPDLYKQNSSKSCEQKSNLNNENSYGPSINFKTGASLKT